MVATNCICQPFHLFLGEQTILIQPFVNKQLALRFLVRRIAVAILGSGWRTTYVVKPCGQLLHLIAIGDKASEMRHTLCVHYLSGCRRIDCIVANHLFCYVG